MTPRRTTAAFDSVEACWVCGGRELEPVHELVFELSAYGSQDPDLASYSGSRLWLRRCVRCRFAQPAALPALPRYFDRMYDQRWSQDWIAAEFDAPTKDYIFGDILGSLSRRLDRARRRLLDVGAHAGRFVSLARKAGWTAEGLELNPQTAAFAAHRTGASVRQLNVHEVEAGTARFDAVTVTDVLEHIPDPVRVLTRVHALLSDGGWIAVKVPCGPSQLRKETWRGRLLRGYQPTVADNLVHVSHFSPGALRRALERAGFADIHMCLGAPGLPVGGGARGWISRQVRLGLHRLSCLLPGGVHLPITFNLQAYARRKSAA
jgi:SAM-dependent methyltransferase